MLAPAPRSLDEALSPAFLSGALGVPVDGVQVEETLVSVATKVRFRIDTEPGAHRAYCLKGLMDPDPPPVPVRVTRSEASFYRDLAPRVGVAVPACRYTGIDPVVGNGLIIMEDVVAAGGRFLTALEPYSVEQAHDSVDQLATLHAAHWGDVGFGHLGRLGNRLAELADAPLRTDAELQALLDDQRGDPLPPAVRDGARVNAAVRALAQRTSGLGETLVHGDTHAGNLYVREGRTFLIDWQLLQRAHWSIDVAYHLGAVLSVDMRRRAERELLNHYLDRLAAHGVSDVPDRAAAWEHYRAAVAYGYSMWAVARKNPRPIIDEFCLRLGTAVDDLECFAALGV